MIQEGMFEADSAPNSPRMGKPNHAPMRHNVDDDGVEREFKRRKLKGGRNQWYDYDEYKKFKGQASQSDIKDVSSLVDQEHTDIAAVARDLYPDHTPQGAQSQLRKQLNGERDMTSDVLGKLEKMIDSGKVATK